MVHAASQSRWVQEARRGPLLIALDPGRLHGAHAYNLDGHRLISRLVVVNTIGRLEQEAPGPHGNHLVGIVDSGIGAKCHPPRALYHRNIPGLIVKVWLGATAGGERDPLDVYPRLAALAEYPH